MKRWRTEGDHLSFALRLWLQLSHCRCQPVLLGVCANDYSKTWGEPGWEGRCAQSHPFWLPCTCLVSCLSSQSNLCMQRSRRAWAGQLASSESKLHAEHWHTDQLVSSACRALAGTPCAAQLKGSPSVLPLPSPRSKSTKALRIQTSFIIVLFLPATPSLGCLTPYTAAKTVRVTHFFFYLCQNQCLAMENREVSVRSKGSKV